MGIDRWWYGNLGYNHGTDTMTETVDVWFGGVHQEVEAHVLNTDDGINIELVNAPIVIDYNEDKQDD